jgi:hypothetical protein
MSGVEVRHVLLFLQANLSVLRVHLKRQIDKMDRSLLRSAPSFPRFMPAPSFSSTSKQSDAKHVLLRLNRNLGRNNCKILWSPANSRSASATHKMFERWAMWFELVTVSPATNLRFEFELTYPAIAHQRLMHVVVMLQVRHRSPQ